MNPMNPEGRSRRGVEKSTHEERKRKRMETASRERDEGEGEMRVLGAGEKEVVGKERGREGQMGRWNGVC
jgi:hypothetical protein